MKNRKLVIGGLYKHFKNLIVRVLMEVRDSETLEKSVVYVHLEDGQVWVRPKKMFLEKIEREGKKFYRFKLIKGK